MFQLYFLFRVNPPHFSQRCIKQLKRKIVEYRLYKKAQFNDFPYLLRFWTCCIFDQHNDVYYQKKKKLKFMMKNVFKCSKRLWNSFFSLIFFYFHLKTAFNLDILSIWSNALPVIIYPTVLHLPFSLHISFFSGTKSTKKNL